ncbi:zinc finger protein CONSTANS-LIKE 5-like [Prosopis cineraria]|uniref:zinc finger protein CONSTANS-LIKE 5-like n=1 Tax=Prosopis cineraria TaxID=364024 RepID=UPI00240EA749|nr:zinc finger protein CONSTANS-LIKE 5-like [Prosopis cineraria]
MGIERGNLKGFRSGSWTVPPKPCDSCKSATAAVFCRADSAFLCMLCDNEIHSANKLALRHERVWMCEVCEQAPASVTCKADAAALCVTCDSDIHSANPLARRHERVPVEPFFDSADSVAKSSAAALNLLVPTDNGIGSDGFLQEESESASWLISNPSFNPKIMDVPDIKSGDMFFPEMEYPLLDFDYSNSFDQNDNNRGGNNDGVVPVQARVMNHMESCFDIDFCRSKLSSINYPTQSFTRQSVSSSSVDVGVVPDGGNTVSEISFPIGQNISNSSESSGIISAGNSTTQLGSSASGMNREARVLRYREKRKNRKFEKTIRYASRKAYAETRPRIKGRFAKRTEMESDFDRLFNAVEPTTDLLLDTQYGVVPSF